MTPQEREPFNPYDPQAWKERHARHRADSTPAAIQRWLAEGEEAKGRMASSPYLTDGTALQNEVAQRLAHTVGEFGPSEGAHLRTMMRLAENQAHLPPGTTFEESPVGQQFYRDPFNPLTGYDRATVEDYMNRNLGYAAGRIAPPETSPRAGVVDALMQWWKRR